MLPVIALILMPIVESLWKRGLSGSSKTPIGGFDFPTHSATIIMLSLFIRTVGGKSNKAIITGQIVTQDDLNGEIPSVLKITPMSFKLVRSDKFPIHQSKDNIITGLHISCMQLQIVLVMYV